MYGCLLADAVERLPLLGVTHPEIVPRKLLLAVLVVAFVAGFVLQFQRSLDMLIFVVAVVQLERHGDGAEIDVVPAWQT